MKDITWTCDRCRAPIAANRTTFETLTGAERLRRPTWDLCRECAAAFWT